MMQRRQFLTAICSLVVASGIGVDAARAESRKMSVEDAHAAAERGELFLVDVRTRWEWQKTGIGASAHAISMHEPNFLVKLRELTGGDLTKPVAMICATGVRSHSLQPVLEAEGYQHIIDVAEGMQGSYFGPGWLAKKLPVKQPPAL